MKNNKYFLKNKLIMTKIKHRLKLYSIFCILFDSNMLHMYLKANKKLILILKFSDISEILYKLLILNSLVVILHALDKNQINMLYYKN